MKSAEMTKGECECVKEAIPCWECAQAAAEERLKRLDYFITCYYSEKARPGQPQPQPR